MSTTNKTNSSITEMLEEIGVDTSFVESVSEAIAARELVDQMIILRHRAGLTQGQMAGMMGVSQSAVSKLERSPDSEITLDQIAEYLSATKHQMYVTILPEDENIVGEVKYFVHMIKERLDQLVEIANGEPHDTTISQGINNFWGELALNLMHIMHSSKKKMDGPRISVTKLEEPQSKLGKKSQVVKS
jgi:transcriptional regulator with XRE-family HTH domain